MDKPIPKLKAYNVQGNEYGTIVFALHNVVARREGANELNIEFEDVESCRHIPELDSYADVKGGVPMKVLVEEHEWSQECGYCERRVYADCEQRIWITDNQVCCDVECAARRENWHRQVGIKED
jgi:hypothetical protein